jgi:hypothetical protein
MDLWPAEGFKPIKKSKVNYVVKPGCQTYLKLSMNKRGYLPNVELSTILASEVVAALELIAK